MSLHHASTRSVLGFFLAATPLSRKWMATTTTLLPNPSFLSRKTGQQWWITIGAAGTPTRLLKCQSRGVEEQNENRTTATASKEDDKEEIKNTASSLTNPTEKLVVGIFVDLDNVVPDPVFYTRDGLAQWIQPIRDFARKDMNGTIGRFQAFANEATITYSGDKEIMNYEDVLEDQEWIGGGEYLGGLANEYYGDTMDDLFDDSTDYLVQTGYDKEGYLRCGVCGQRMKLSKKDKAKGLSERDKLNKHTRQLHDREQQKRKNRLNSLQGKKKKRFLEGKEGNKMRKYKSAQVGYRKQRTASGNAKNDLLQILNEMSVGCKQVKDVDKTLTDKATQWMLKQTGNITKVVFAKKGKKKQTQKQETNVQEPSGTVVSAALVIVSRDSDFAPLLNKARKMGILAVSMNPRSTQQTRALVEASDLVVVRQSDDEIDQDYPGPLVVDNKCN